MRPVRRMGQRLDRAGVRVGADMIEWHLTSKIVWRPIETAPLGKRIFVADLIDRIRHIGLAERHDDGRIIFNCPGIPATPASHWTHWADLPDLPELPEGART